ncbi:FkbM family methyltransferase [Lentibacter sp. XHP0401]|jgi:FkbM family methyltransferase|uniref:FkbM family methyltransferase n=1 Tax=Lentibacter sp. XHP0401 TaxID=2984334 RepID=UPI0021E78540|nr:FkbM family methyltransferase [Lentibacter sp. XHP0401]MCV2891874.1 FkbM family methyltransferase [Lentibacter sp. XHP0401]
MDTHQTDTPTADTPVIRSRGVRVPKNPSVMTPKIKRSLRLHGYEGKEVNAAMRVVKAGDTVLELGGGIGFVSTILAKKRDVKAIHTFEANPHLINFQHQMHALNDVDTITTYNALLAARKGKPQKFYVRENFLASSLEPEVTNMPVKSVEEVEVLGINATFNQIKPDVFICDIEGAEADLLPHLKYSGLRAAVIELHPQWIGAKGVRAVFDAMHEAGLTYFPRLSDQKVVCFRKEWDTK